MTIRIASPHAERCLISIYFSILFLFESTHQFTEETFKFSVSEDAPISTIIGHLSLQNGYTYRLSRGNSKIRFDEQTLELSVSSLLDRESENAIDMLIITSPPSIVHILIDVMDVNDNPPKFPVDIQKIEIPETAQNGWRVQIAGATDPDEGKNGTIGKYELAETVSATTLDGQTPFRIVQSEGFVFLEVSGKLDRETRDLYSMRLTATDRGIPELSSSCLLNIIVLDINDNPPNFGIRSLHLNWNGVPNTPLFHLNATDSDSGDNSRLTYRIHGAAREMFSITDGNILVTKNSTECSPRCEFLVEARDSGVPPLSTTLNVIVDVEYGNEHEPNINIRFYPSDYPFIVVQPEDVNGKTLAILSITDSDGPLGENATIWMENGDGNHIFSLITRQSINILTLKHVELAEKEHYTLEFGANDGQKPTEKMTRKTLKIYFKKHVKSAFVHVEKEIHVTVEKDTVTGSFVAHVETNCSATCTFELARSEFFRIDESNGIIVTSSTLPDDVSSYHLPIRIHLPPPSTQYLETDVFVRLIQESVPKGLIRSSEALPIHLKRAYTFATWQNVSVGTIVGRLPKAQVYTTIDSESELGVFPDGAIFVGKSVNSDFVTLPVTLENRNTTQETVVTVILKSLNLHSPVCQATVIRITENSPIGSVIGKVGATDADAGLNGVVSYRILTDSGNDDVMLHLEASTGRLMSLKRFYAENGRNYTFRYEASDFGRPSKTASCTGTILIDDVNDKTPKFSMAYYTAKVAGNQNETVSILKADDEEEEEGVAKTKKRRIHYRLLNYNDYFHVGQESGEIRIVQDIPMTWQRLNISVEAVNVDSQYFPASRTFLLVTVVKSPRLECQMISESVVRIFKNDNVGAKVGHLEVTSSETVFWSIEDARFRVDSAGNILLIRETAARSTSHFDVVLTSEDGAKTKRFKFHVEILDFERTDDVEQVMEIELQKSPKSLEIIDLSENWKTWKIAKTVIENPGDMGSAAVFSIKDQKLVREENKTIADAFVVLESEDSMESSKSFKLLHIFTNGMDAPATVPIACPSSVHLISPPATVSLPHNCTNAKLQTQRSPLQIHEGALLIPAQTELISHVDLVESKSTKPFMMTLIKDEPSEDVRFATNAVLMLLSSIHPIGASFGRVTAESGYRIRYYLVGTDKISIDADTGELFLRDRFYRNLNDILIVAVIPKGISKAKVSIEVIEDRLVLPKSNFFITSHRSLNSKIPIGRIPLERDDVIIDVIDEHFYIRNSEVFTKRHFTPASFFYDIKGTVKKGKLSAPINVTLFFGSSMDGRSQKRENELMFEVEENSAIGTVVGVVPNSSTSKYRLVDPFCGLQIDQGGVIRTTTVFDREKTSLIKTKMIEPSENRIWDLLIFIGDVNDNKPKILNAPERIIVSGTSFEYQLDWEDFDDIASDVHFSVLDGDAFGHLEVSDSGVIRLSSMPSESFNATIRIHDNRPPFKVYSDDVTIEFYVAKRHGDVTCDDVEFWDFANREGSIGTMTASENVTWRIVPQHRYDFEIDPINGNIQKTSGASEFGKTASVVNMKIQAISYDGERSGFCYAKIHVTKSSQNAGDFRRLDIFSNATYEFYVSEATDRFTEVGQIHLNSYFDDVIFRVENDDFNFTISPFDGTIFTNSPLDFEDVNTYHLNVTVSSSSAIIASCHVIIHVVDENDESPRFITGDVVNLRVTENLNTVAYPMVIGSSIAEDLDEGQNGVVTYSILSGNTSLFAVNSTTGEILSLLPLDCEESSIYELLIEAKDAGIPSLSATSEIRIHVDDVNDNAPEFELPSYFVRIAENLKMGAKILRIQASDKDLNPELQYSFEMVDDVDSSLPFRIDAGTGWVTVAGKVDREQNEEFRIGVVVSDGAKSSKTLLEILVEDANDNYPVIEDESSDVYIPDGVDFNSIVHVISVHDSDRQDHLKYSLNDSNFKILENGEIRLAGPPITASTPVRITVTDDVGHVALSECVFHPHQEKDFPIFMEKLEVVTVKEHDAQELAVFKAKGSGGADVRYSIVSRCRRHLEIGSVTGILRTKSSLDREELSECPVYVIATSFIDNKPLSRITKMLIKIVDINDNSPRFDHPLYRFNVTENSGATPIGHVAARDLDNGRNSRIFYEIVSGDPTHEFVVTENGLIESVRDLDRETTSEYRLILEAIDDGKPRRRGNTTVIINVLDEDDNAPRFSRIFHVEVAEDVKPGEPVIQLSASDSDEKSEHRYVLESGGEPIPFRVEENTGMVFVNDTLDYEKKSSYRIKVRLTDGAWLIETSLFVNVKDVNDNFPKFDNAEYFFVSQENTSELGQLHASDQDSMDNGKIRYCTSSPYFRIHPTTGVLTRLRPQLPESLMTLEVIAFDHGVPRRRTSATVHVAHKSAFQESIETRIREDAKPGDVIGNGAEPNCEIFPRDIATVSRNGDIVLKRSLEKDKKFWILVRDRRITEHVVVRSKDQKINGGDDVVDVVFNVTSSATWIGRIQVETKEEGEEQCVEYFKNESTDTMRIFNVTKNGFIVRTSSTLGNEQRAVRFTVTCHDDIWPIRNQKTIHVTVNMLAEHSGDLWTRKAKRRKTSPSHRLPSAMSVRVSSVSPRGTILWDNAHRIPIFMENQKSTNYSRSTRQLVWTGIEKGAESTQFEIFNKQFERALVTVDFDNGIPPCPIFPKRFYFFTKANDSMVHDFAWSAEEQKTCGMEVHDQNLPFFITNTSRLYSARPLLPGTYQFTLKTKLTSSESAAPLSQCHVTVTVTPEEQEEEEEAAERHAVSRRFPTVVFANRNEKNLFQLPRGTKLKTPGSPMFSATDSGIVRSDGVLSGSVYHIEVDDPKQDTIRILFDDVAEEDDVRRGNVIDYHYVTSSDASEFLQSQFLRIPFLESCHSDSSSPHYSISENCHVTIFADAPVPITNLTLTSSNNATWHLNVIQEPENAKLNSTQLENNAVTIQIVSQKSGLSRLIADLRQTYSDMKIHCLATWQISEDVKYHATIAIVDRNGVVVAAPEAHRTLSSFLKKRQPSYLEMLGFQKDPCLDVICVQKNATCQTVLGPNSDVGESRLVSWSSLTIFDVPMKQLIGICTCTNGCEPRIPKNDDVIMTCDDVDCGPRGKCALEEAANPICHCYDGFESLLNCDKVNDVFSTSSEGYVEIAVKNGSVENGRLKCHDEACDVQKIELDFRTIRKDHELLKVTFGKQTAFIEIIYGTITFSISDAYARPIETKIERRVNDGRWHRLLLQMSDDGRKISIQVDGRGKEVISRVALPMLFTSKRIQLMTSSDLCFRRLLVQNQFLHPAFSTNTVFHVVASANISAVCQFDAARAASNGVGFLSNFSNTTTVILLSVLALISLIALSVCVLAIKRRCALKSSGGTKTERSNGWKSHVVAPRGTTRGHVNMTMIGGSTDGDTYGVATVGGMKSTSTDDMINCYTYSSKRRYQPSVAPHRRDGHINMAYL